MSITSEQRSALLAALRSGRDLFSACDKAQVDPLLVRGDADLLRECEAAFQTGTSKLRSELTLKCLERSSNSDIPTLQRLIEQRSDLAREQFKAPASEAQQVGFDLQARLAQLNDDELDIAEALITGPDVELFRKLLHERAMELAVPIAREMVERSERWRDAHPPEPQLEDLTCSQPLGQDGVVAVDDLGRAGEAISTPAERHDGNKTSRERSA